MHNKAIGFKEVIRNMSYLAQGMERVKLMEVCGTHTMSAFRSGLRSLMPDNVSLISGPGCPVCVTPDSYINTAVSISRLKDVITVTYGDMIRVPGTVSSLEIEKAKGADIRVVYSPSETLKIAEEHRDRRVVFLGVGFETTAPLSAMVFRKAYEKGLDNVFLLSAHKLIPPAMSLLVSDRNFDIQGFMCPGHVSVITGPEIYKPIAREYGVPCVVTGFEAYDMAMGINMLLSQIREGIHEVENQYTRSVKQDGNSKARGIVREVFQVCDSEWRGLGSIPESGLKPNQKYRDYDAWIEFQGLEVDAGKQHSACICGEVLKGLKKPPECPVFALECTPDNPYGPCMVSSEGSCAAYYKYSRRVD